MPIFNDEIINLYSNNSIVINIEFNLSDIASNIDYIIEKEQEIIDESNYNHFLTSFKNENNNQDIRYNQERYNFKSYFPKINTERYLDLDLKDLPIDKKNTIVIVGFGENSFKGCAKTRLEIEKNGKISIETCLDIMLVYGND